MSLFFLFIVLFCTSFFFFFNDTATTEIYTLSLHDALPISFSTDHRSGKGARPHALRPRWKPPAANRRRRAVARSEEHTSELQSRLHLVCRLLLEKKKKTIKARTTSIQLNQDRWTHQLARAR